MMLKRYKQIKTLLEWLTVTKISLAFLIWVLLFAVIYWITSSLSQGEHLASGSAVVKGFWDSLYFSTVTATTLGYGDIAPVGWLRLAAAIEVIGGLVIAGLIVSVLAAMPMHLMRAGLKECVGTWIERAQFKKGERLPFYTLTEFSLAPDGTTLTCIGENFDGDETTHGSTFRARLIANQFPTLIFEYDCDAGLEEFTTGIAKVEMRLSPSGDCNELHGESFDAAHGRRDRIHSIKVTDQISLEKLNNPRTRLEEMRRLVQELFNEKPPF